MPHETIFCRARLEADCLHDTPDDPEEPMDTDGTFDGYSIVCTTCYVRLMPLTPSGVALIHELHPAITDYNAVFKGVR